MINCEDFYKLLKTNNIDFFTGVPDSLFKNFLAFLHQNVKDENNIVAANEGAAMAIAAGRYLATGKIPFIYMQNSGLGNAINPLTSLLDKDVYQIPALLFIGWRGEPGKHDEPQHLKQGKITLKLLETLGIPYSILPDSLSECEIVVNQLITEIKNSSIPHALIAQKNIFNKCTFETQQEQFEMDRETALGIVMNELTDKDVVLSTTGKISRELYDYRNRNNQSHEQDFLNVGSMGHTSSIALSIAQAHPDRRVFCLDGDGALIMHMGSLAVIASNSPGNFKHILFNNGSHDSVGGFPNCGLKIDMPSLAIACGYKTSESVKTSQDLKKYLSNIIKSEGPVLLEIKIKKGGRSDLCRPSEKPVENKKNFMNFLIGKK